jgi:hypothetical protein
MQLLAALRDLVDELSRQRLEQRHVLHHVVALRHAPGAVVEVGARRARLGVEHRQALAHRLLVPQRAAEGLARAHVLERQAQRLLAVAHRHRTQRDALGLEVLHHGVEALAFLAQEVAGGHAHAVEVQLGRVRTAPAGLVELAAHTEARSAPLHREDGNLARRLASACSHEDEFGVHAGGDVELAAVDHPVVAVAAGARAHARHVRARPGLGDGHRRDRAPGRDAGHPARQLRGAAGMVQMRAGHVGVHEHGHDEAAEGALAQRLGKHEIGERIGSRAAVLGGVHDPEQPGVAHALQHLARHEALLLPGRAVRLDLARQEARHLLAQQLALGAEVDVLHRLHAYIRNTPKRGLAGMGAFRLADRPSASTRRVSAGSITPSSHSRALA